MGAGSFGQPWAAPALGKSRSTPPSTVRCIGVAGGRQGEHHGLFA